MCTKGFKPVPRKSSHKHADGSSTVRRMPSFPKSMFAAGTAKRTAEEAQRTVDGAQRTVDGAQRAQRHAEGIRGQMDSDGAPEEWRTPLAQEEGDPSRRPRFITGRAVAPGGPLTPAEWRKLREESGRSAGFELHMMKVLLKTEAELDIAKSLLSFVALETGTLSYQLLLSYLTMCVKGGHDAETLDLYQVMRGVYPVLDTGASTLFIKAFSRTPSWQEALPLLMDIKKILSPTARNYSDIIGGAVQHGDAATAWRLYDEVIQEGLVPSPDTWQALFEGGARGAGGEVGNMSRADYEERLLGILGYMRDNQVYPQKILADAIKTWCCESEVESIQLNPQEYEHLKGRVMAEIIEGKDVFHNTTPEELDSFKAFVRSCWPWCRSLERQGRTTLVLGRKHILTPSKSWDRRKMALIQKKAHCFFTEKHPEDDPFLLYAALNSGNPLSVACLSDALTRRLFFKWQRGHQMGVFGLISPVQRVRFKGEGEGGRRERRKGEGGGGGGEGEEVIPPYDTIIQGGDGSWHIPYDNSEEDRSTYEVPQRWLCLTKQP
ncbi:hypothetical protein CRUP_015160 [Coryphaenoides rupestris]|nr:hypothetical protein CRUP_015160 [Coryphaenoides rupestris]